MNEFWLHLHWTLFLWVILTIWHYLNQWWLVYWRISEPMIIGLQTHISANRPQWVNCVLISAYLSGASSSIKAFTILGHMYAVAETFVQLLLRMTLNFFVWNWIRLVGVKMVGIQTQIAKFMGPTWAHLGPVGTRWALCWLHEPCYHGTMVI